MAKQPPGAGRGMATRLRTATGRSTASQRWLTRQLNDPYVKAAKERGLPGQVVTLNRSLIVPFLQYADDRDLREAAWRAWTLRGSGQGAGGAKTDNLPLIAEILALRHERAQLLGYADFAAFKLEPEVAGTAERVEE